MNEQSIQKVNMEELVYSKLKLSIYNRFIRPGSQLVEAAIASKLNVSRTPVRAAIKKLEHEGYVQVIPNRGAFVIKPTAEEMKDAYSVRLLLEKQSAGLAAERISKEDIERLYKLIDEEKRTFDHLDTDNYYKMNDSFHFIIAEASQNKLLLEYVKDIVSRTTIYVVLFDPLDKLKKNPSIDEHIAIVRALESRNKLEAEKAMEKHLTSVIAGLKLEDSELNEDILFL
ncbi:GntR family transcriptional regulator [Bacillus sp. RG28]|uniref:GntR family transcriptional regulator n=1 Tax=Gottfriedia endophytica TaxID=2820819 RepID=A0A940NSQ2_9BACI|nr:GntR family transcriptional regulator [Gottfriedia endophytica]MBP0726101.1 GntR family transcriptional regulator [Gottfriedia endophytica]